MRLARSIAPWAGLLALAVLLAPAAAAATTTIAPDRGARGSYHAASRRVAVKHLRFQKDAELLQFLLHLGLMKATGAAASDAKRMPAVLPVSRKSRFGVTPRDSSGCPSSDPIRAYGATGRGGRCVYELPGDGFRDKAAPQRCYATDEEAQLDGCRASTQ
jgi:hypothetical protein